MTLEETLEEKIKKLPDGEELFIERPHDYNRGHQHIDLTTDDIKRMVVREQAARAEVERLRESYQRLARHHNEKCNCMEIY